MGIKHLTGLISLIIFITVKTDAAVIQCTNATGKLVFTDNPANCADKKNITELNQSIKSDNNTFHHEIPDLMQTLTTAGFAGDGQQFCAPVAVSNSLVWFEKNKSQQYQIDLVKKLSSTNYMNTSTKTGTNIFGITQGVHKYAIERWGGYKTLEYSGWSKAPVQFRSNLEKPTLNWMTQGLHKKGTVWLNIGWYNAEDQNYKRTGGHWVTLVGYEQGKLIIHDPSPRAGKTASSQFVSVGILNSGQLFNGKRVTTAKNHFIIEDGMLISSKGSLAIIDGAVKFELN